jgi:hypothetical protein
MMSHTRKHRYNHFDDADGDDDGQQWCSTPDGSHEECFLNARAFSATVDIPSPAGATSADAIGTVLAQVASGGGSNTGATNNGSLSVCVLLDDFTLRVTLSVSAPLPSASGDQQGDGNPGGDGHGDGGGQVSNTSEHHSPSVQKYKSIVGDDGRITVTDGMFFPLPGINSSASLNVHLALSAISNDAATLVATISGFVAVAGDVHAAASMVDQATSALQPGSAWGATLGDGHTQTLVVVSAPVASINFVVRGAAPVTAASALVRLTSSADSGALATSITNLTGAVLPTAITFRQNEAAPVHILVPVLLGNSNGVNGTDVLFSGGIVNTSNLPPGSQITVIASSTFSLNVSTPTEITNSSAIVSAVQQGVSSSLGVDPAAVAVTVALGSPDPNANGTVTSVVQVAVQHGAIGDVSLPDAAAVGNNVSGSGTPTGVGIQGGNATVAIAASSDTATQSFIPSFGPVPSPSGNATVPTASLIIVLNVTDFSATVADEVATAVPLAVKAALVSNNVTDATVSSVSVPDTSTAASVALPGPDVTTASSQLLGSAVSGNAQAGTQQRSGVAAPPPSMVNVAVPPPPPVAAPPPPWNFPVVIANYSSAGITPGGMLAVSIAAVAAAVAL